MGDLRRYFEDDMAYFVTTATKNRQNIFLNSKMCRILLVTIEYYKTIFDYKVHGYCLMPDHLHLILTPTSKYNLSVIMKMIKGTFARKVNKLTNHSGSLWQFRYFDEAIRSHSQMVKQLDYTHNNPIKAGLVTSIEDYPFSSFNHYHSIPNPKGAVLEIDPIEAN